MRKRGRNVLLATSVGLSAQFLDAFVVPQPRGSLVRLFEREDDENEKSPSLLHVSDLNPSEEEEPAGRSIDPIMLSGSQHSSLLASFPSSNNEQAKSLIVSYSRKQTSTPPLHQLRSFILQKFSKFKTLKPGSKFRLQLGIAAVVGFGVLSLTHPQFNVFKFTKAWWLRRGFSGLSALGRSVAYGWALLVAYPRLLDRRAHERNENKKQRAIDRRRNDLARLAGEVSRLRQELANIDAEIRSFRREIISLRIVAASASDSVNNDGFVDEAIAAELAHLASIRSETQASYTAAQQTWMDLQSRSPQDSWEYGIVR